MKNLHLLILFVLGSYVAFSQAINCYPTHWWVGMKNPKLQIMIHANNIGNSSLTLTPYAGVKLDKITKAQNPNYVFLDLSINATARPGVIKFNSGGQVINYNLKARRAGKGTQFAQGVTSSDFIYFLMPDRFSNGDPSNDRIAGMKDQSLNRDSIFLRHGGDLQGIMNHLDYLQGLGVSALWMTPVIENDMPDRTEHGYAFTDHYKIEPRLGGEEAYIKLGNELHRRGMKLIQDAVYNHMGLYHFLVQDPPDNTWLHQWPSLTLPNYKEQVFFDPYAAQIDKKKMADGWFTNMMPDINQGNPFFANFLIQHAIWSVEQFGIDAWRIDTYKYVDLGFMNSCNKALTDEYPKLTLFGEAWGEGVVNQAYFTKSNLNTNFKSNLGAVLDFEFLFNGIQPAVTQGASGINKLYQTVSLDFLYKDPMTNVIFLDNHDMTRFFSQVGERVDKQKMALSWLLTCRGIPQLYYGTEILMKGVANPDGWVRLDFPGGWNGDSKNVFTGQGITRDEQSVLDLTRRLANFRKTASAIQTGKMMQFVPENGVYVYFRYDARQTVMCIMNANDNAATFPLDRFKERMNGFTKAYDVATGNTFSLENTMSLGGNYLLLLELQR